MTIKTIVTTKASDGLEYPKLMRTTEGLIVLFKDSKVGTVVVTNTHHTMGRYSINWAMEDFTDFSGTVTLQNMKE